MDFNVSNAGATRMMNEIELPDTKMSAADKAANDQFVADFNKTLNEGKGAKGSVLEMDDFLKILTTQLTHQDPAAPVEDKEFIAQMAQISSLKEMSNMAADIARLTAIFGGSEATASLGKNVEIVDGEKVVQGTVRAVTRDAEPTVLVNGSYYQWKNVAKVFDTQE
ncbi:MAG: flagellar hook assembly protein FlgD [Spirochaetaceae bacterium]|jgi:flagellar basal-body rod modification protein FlgD|nr:flagellar hook assembly protein FlgD [Spirochaetaceae bacterium]